MSKHLLTQSTGFKSLYTSVRSTVLHRGKRQHRALTRQERFAQWQLRRRVKNKNFTVIANNCFGGFIYQQLNLSYQTPMAGLFFHAPCYITLLKNLKGYLNSSIRFIEKSRYDSANKARAMNHPYPIGLLNGDVEIHFLHYLSKEKAEIKWYRRVGRIHWNNLFVKFCDREYCTESHLETFDRLPFFHKVCFTAKHYPQLKSAVWIEECNNESQINDKVALSLTSSLYRKHFDLAGWLNGDQVKALKGYRPSALMTLARQLTGVRRH